MARLDVNAAKRGWRILGKSDEEHGRWLAELCRPSLERAACKAVGIDSIYTGRNVLAEPSGSQYARRLVQCLTDEFLDAALQFDDGAPEALATWLSLRGDYERAGRAMRKSTSYRALVAYLNREVGMHRMRATKLLKQIKRIENWAKVGGAIRNKERGPRMSNSDLARAIADRTGDPINSIRVELPKMGLDAGSWPETVKHRPQKKTNRKFSSRGTLRK